MENIKEMRPEDILNELNGVRNKYTYPVYIPSLKKDVMFKEMSTGQEKNIVKCIVDNPIHNTEFIFTIRNIIKENCAENIDIDSLTLIDKGMICLVMRSKSIGNEYKLSKDGVDYTINLDDVINKLKEIEIPENKLIEDDDFDVVCGVPTIKIENELEENFKSKYIESAKKPKEFMTEIETLFDIELIKYVKNIKIKKEDGVYDVDMENYDYDDRGKFINALNNKILIEILNYIDEYKKVFSKALTVLDNNLNDSVEVELDRNFFIIQ